MADIERSACTRSFEPKVDVGKPRPTSRETPQEAEATMRMLALRDSCGDFLEAAENLSHEQLLLVYRSGRRGNCDDGFSLVQLGRAAVASSVIIACVSLTTAR